MLAKTGADAKEHPARRCCGLRRSEDTTSLKRQVRGGGSSVEVAVNVRTPFATLTPRDFQSPGTQRLLANTARLKLLEVSSCPR